jgi:phosphoribosylaminoimidazolecarboxamide formyltransferase/IMP cyclohydrolase
VSTAANGSAANGSAASAGAAGSATGSPNASTSSNHTTFPSATQSSVVDETAESTRRPIRRALVSVYDKTGLTELARGLHAAGVELVSTGSTAARIADAGVPVTPVQDVTGFPECLDGRVKTLHPRIHAGVLADLRLDSHRAQLTELGVEPFELVIVNLYPFRETVASGASADECVEQIDIGGPSMVRAAAKNHPSVAVVVNPGRYDDVLAAVAAGGFDLHTRKRLAAEAFQHTAAYDVAVASWFTDVYAPQDATGAALPEFVAGAYHRKAGLRYGENPHQGAALYTDGRPGGLANAEQLHGKEMSFNNYVDTEAARRAAYDQDEPCVAIIKHANPCGIAIGADVAEAHRKAHACDPLSAFGGVIAVNRPVTVALAEQVAEIFTEVIAAPGYEDGAVEVLARKKNIRVLRVDGTPAQPLDLKQISGGAVVQHTDVFQSAGDDPATWTLATGEPLSAADLRQLAFAWRACRAVKSNAILLAKDGATVGVGMGQVNRVDSARLAVQRAGAERAAGSFAASDAFFPFPDGLEVLTAAGVRAVAQPGGSMRDELVLEAAKSAGITMYFTGTRHFFH